MTNVYGEQEIIHDEWNRECEWALARLCITGSVSSLRSGSHFCVKINTIQTFRWIFEDTQLPDGVAFSLADLSPHTPCSLPSASQISAFINKQLTAKASFNISFRSKLWYFLSFTWMWVSLWCLFGPYALFPSFSLSISYSFFLLSMFCLFYSPDTSLLCFRSTELNPIFSVWKKINFPWCKCPVIALAR